MNSGNLESWKPDPDKLAQSRRGLADADPTESSLLPTSGPFTHIGNDAQYDYPIEADGEGNRYYRLDSPRKAAFTEVEQVAARMLKGIVNVSDVVRSPESGVYRSRELDLENVRHDTSEAEVRADLALFELLMSDVQHYPGTNMVYDADRKRVAYFDFDAARFFFTEPSEAFIQNAFLRMDQESLGVFINKLDALKTRFDGEEGEQHLDAIISASGKSVLQMFGLPKKYEHIALSPQAAFDLFYSTLMGRLERLRRAAEQRMAELQA